MIVMTTHTTRHDAMVSRVACHVMLTKLRDVTAVTLLLLLVLVLIGDVTPARHSMLPRVDIESTDDELAQRDQPMVSHSVNNMYVPSTSAACQTS